VGRAGTAASRALIHDAGPDAVRACDSAAFPEVLEAKARLEGLGVTVAVGEDGTAPLAADPAPRCVVKSPGIPFDAPLIAEAERRGIPVLDEAELAWRLDGRPFVAVTGTNGKSTTCELVRAVLAADGRDPLLGGNSQFAPPLSALPRDHGAVVAAEISSFQLEGCPALLPDVAVLTNLSADHLDRHGTMRRYAGCKRRLFLREDRVAPVAAVNVGDRFGAELARELAGRGASVVRFGGDGDFRLRRAEWSLQRSRLRLDTPDGEIELELALPGRHNAENVLAALATARALGVDPDVACRAVESARPVPGRFEPLGGPGQPDVVVDYAHNPAGVRVALETARGAAAERPRARVIAVLSGLAIDTEPQRRAMGEAAAGLADTLLLTTERWAPFEPGDRLPTGLEAGARGVPGVDCRVRLERGEAIAEAIRGAGPGDVVLILGRGAQDEPLFDGAGEPRPFDDRVEARRALDELAAAASPSTR
jgi:UDP-N-acetylmuramoyl-L-alanyl-D-glutamate--2,6-diaminopimelate ligase